jgi:glycerophosphoryl diester phosphodiesterase
MNQRVLNTPMLLGHRGSPKAKCENTLESFQLALEAGLNGIELDVHRSFNGVLVVHHDFFLPDGRLIAALTDAEIIGFELPGNLRVPTLEAVLVWAKSSGAFVNVEIKSETMNSDGRELETVRLIERLDLADQILISSFNPASIAWVRLANARLETGLLFDNKSFDNQAAAPWLLEDGKTAIWMGVKAIHPHHSLVTPELMRRAKSRGWRVNVWTVNDLELGVKLLEMGVNALIGDFPEVLLEARERFLHAKTPKDRLA